MESGKFGSRQSRELVFVRHARDRMLERGITEADIRTVLSQYDTLRPAVDRGQTAPAEIYIGPCRGRRLKVYVERGSNPPKIKTAVWEGD